MNTLTYSELQDICESKKILVKDLCSAIGMTYMGLKSGLERQSLGVKYVSAICEMLKITPNQFFRIPENATIIGNNIQQTGAVNMQQVQDGMDILHEQLRKKDEQIDKLLTLLNK